LADEWPTIYLPAHDPEAGERLADDASRRSSSHSGVLHPTLVQRPGLNQLALAELVFSTKLSR